MDQLYVFLIRNDVWIYFVCALGAVWYLMEFVRGQRGLRRAAFSLERENSLRTRNNAALLLLVFAAVTGVVLYTNVLIRPNLPVTLLRPPTPTPDPFNAVVGTPVPRLTRLTLPTATPIIAPTATLRSRIEGVPGGAAASGPVEAEVEAIRLGCTERIDIGQPVSGGTVSGGVSVFGSAVDPAFAFYDLEINGPQTADDWVSLLANTFNQPVTNGFLGGSNLEGWRSGVYQLRLTVYDNAGGPVGQCTIQFALDN